MPTHMFQVTSFKAFTDDIRTSPSMSHVTRSGSLESRIDIESRDNSIFFYLSLQPVDRQSICSSVTITFSVMNQYSADHYTKQLDSYTCGLFGNQVYDCQMDREKLLEESGLCIDDTVTFVATFKLPVCGLIVPVFGEPSDLRTVSQMAAENADLFLQLEDADISFQIGRNNNDTIPAHRAIVKRRCPAFKNILAESMKDPVVIDDVALTVFLSVLRFLYCNEIVIERNFVFETLAAAQKFSLPDLTFAVACLMQQEPRILPVVLNYATSAEENRFALLCSHMIGQDVKSFLVDKFMLLTQASVTAVVADQSLAFNEYDLWQRCKEWAEQEQEKRSGKAAVDPKDLRSLMKPFLYHFRMTAMDLTQFTSGPADSGILTLEEVVDVYRYFANLEPPKFFQSEKRAAPAV